MAALTGGRAAGPANSGTPLVERGGRPCDCGKRGCLEAYASEPAIVARARETVPELDPRTIEAILAHADEPQVHALLADAGERVGIALANLVNLFNPGTDRDRRRGGCAWETSTSARCAEPCEQTPSTVLPTTCP